MSWYWPVRVIGCVIAFLGVAGFTFGMIGALTDSDRAGNAGAVCAISLIALAFSSLIGLIILGEIKADFSKPVRMTRADKQKLAKEKSRIELQRRIDEYENENGMKNS